MAKFRMSIGKRTVRIVANNSLYSAPSQIDLDNFNDRLATSGPNDWPIGTSGLIYNLGAIEWDSNSDDQLLTIPGLFIPGHEYLVGVQHVADSIGNNLAIRCGRYGVEDFPTLTVQQVEYKNMLCVEDDYLQIKFSGSSARDQKVLFIYVYEWLWNTPFEVDLPPELNDAELQIVEDDTLQGRSVDSITDLTFFGKCYDAIRKLLGRDENATDTEIYGFPSIPYDPDFIPVLIEYSEDNGATWKEYFNGRVIKSAIRLESRLNRYQDVGGSVTMNYYGDTYIAEVESTDIAEIINSRRSEKVGMELYAEEGFTGLPQLWCDVDGNTYAYELHEALRYIICYLTDGRARLDSNYFENLLEENFASRYPVLMPFNPGAGDYDGFRVSFDELFTELRKWFACTLNFYKPNGIPTVRIEPYFYLRESFRLYDSGITIENQRKLIETRITDNPNSMSIGQPKTFANSEDFEPIEVFGEQNSQSGEIDAVTNLIFDSTAAGAQPSDVALYQALKNIAPGPIRVQSGANDPEYFNQYTLTGAGTTFQDDFFPLTFTWRYYWPSYYKSKYYDYNGGNDQLVETDMLGTDYVSFVELDNVELNNNKARLLESRNIGPNQLENHNFALGQYETSPTFANQVNGWESDRYGTSAGSWVYRWNPGAVEVRYADPSGGIFYYDLGRNFGDELKNSYIGWMVEFEEMNANNQNCKIELVAFDDIGGPSYDFTMLEIGSGTNYDPTTGSLYAGGYFSGVTDKNSGGGNGDIRYVGFRVVSTGSGATLEIRIKWLWIYDPFNLGAINQPVQFADLRRGRVVEYSRQIRNGITNLKIKSNGFI